MEAIKNKFRLAKIITVVMFCLILVMAFLYIRQRNEAQKVEHDFGIKKQTDLAIKAKIQKEATIISRQVDKYGAQHVTISATENLFPSSVFKSPIAVSAGILDTTAMALKIQKKQIQDLLVINATITAKNLFAQKQLDSLKREYFSYADKYVKLRFTPADTIRKVDAKFDFEYNAELTTVQYYKRTLPLIGLKKSFIDIYSNDPRTTINGVRKFTVEQTAPQFGLRLQMRAIYGLTSNKFYMGPGVSFDLGRFNILGYAYYNYTDNRWQKTFGINYDLIRF